MLLIDGWGATARRLLVAAVLATSFAPRAADAAPQTAAGERRASRAESCTDCAKADSLRRTRRQLLERIDSLKWEVEHRRLSGAERQRMAELMSRAIRDLESSMDDEMHERTIVLAAETESAAAAEQAARAMTVVASRARPRGYLGVTFDGPWAETGPPDERVIRFYQYPRIALVEASSPAERAGVAVGDTLVALNGDDVRENEISFTRLLVPNRNITMRVRRDGSPRDFRVTVGEPPEFYVRRVSPAPRPPAVPETPRGRVRVYSAAPPAPAAPEAPEAQPKGFMYWFGNDALAGARLETVRGGLAKALGVADGVLVLTTVPGSPAYDSGLKEGDVITQAGSRKVRTLGELQRAIAAADGDEVRLVVTREKKRREITLRW